MPSAMMVAAHQMGDANLRHAAKSFKARSPIFLTQATEAERAKAEAQHCRWRMKKRLADMLQPPHAVLSHAISPTKLYRSLSQAKRRGGKVKRRSKVCNCLFVYTGHYIFGVYFDQALCDYSHQTGTTE